MISPCLSRGLIKCCIIIAYDLVPIFFVINDHILVPLLMGTMKFDSCFSPSVTKKATLDLLTPSLSASCPIWVLHILTDSWGIAEVFFFLRLFEAFLVKCFSSSLEVCGGNRLLHHCFVFWFFWCSICRCWPRCYHVQPYHCFIPRLLEFKWPSRAWWGSRTGSIL